MLVDALVAIGVMAIVLTTAATVVGDGARRTSAGERGRLAALEARSRLAEVGADIPLTPGRSGGEDGDLVWTVDIAPEAGATALKAGRLLSVSVTVADGEGATLATLRSLRFAGTA